MSHPFRKLGHLPLLAAATALVLCATLPAAGENVDSDAATTTGIACLRTGEFHEAHEPRLRRKLAKPPKERDKPAEANRWYQLQRTGDAPMDPSLLESAREQAARMPRAPGDVLKWEDLGPGNIGGRTRALLVDPANAAVMLTGGVSGGVWKTSNGGTTWNRTDDLMYNLAVTTLAFERQDTAQVNTRVVYAGTGEGFFNGDAVRGAGIFKSNDGGNTWRHLPATNTSDFHYVNKIVTSPNDAATLYAATRTGVWKSTDGGTSWNRVLINNGSGGNNGTLVNTLAFDAGMVDLVVRSDVSPDWLIASSGLASTDGLYRSQDAGASWTRALTATNFGRASLAVAPSNQLTMYACVASNSTFRLLNVYRSTNGGVSWSARVAGSYNSANVNWLLLTNPVIANLVGCGYGLTNSQLHQGWYDNVIAVAPHNPDIVFAGGIDMFRSDDGGANWKVISYWWIDTPPPPLPQYNHADHHAITFHPQWNGTTNQTLFTGNDGGVYRTNNALATAGGGSYGGVCYSSPSVASTVTWTNLNNHLNITQFYHGAVYPSPSTRYLGGTQDNGTPQGSDAAGVNGWVDKTGGDGGYVAVNPNNTNIVFAEYTQKSMVRSTDGGNNFADCSAGLTESNNNFPFIAPFRMDPQNPDRIWYGGRSPWRSNNASSAASAASVTWSQAGTAFASSISAWAIAPANSDIVYAGTQGGQIYRTSTATTNVSTTAWTQVSGGLPSGGFISWIEVDPNDATGNTVYATQSLFGMAHVFRTTTGGTSGWTNITANLPDIPAHCIVVRPGNASTLFVGTDLGVFRSRNTGASWESVNSAGFANVVVETLQFQTPEKLYAFTHGRGAWRATIDLTAGNETSCLSTDTLATSANWIAHAREPATSDPTYGGLTALDFDAANTALRARIHPDPGTAGLPLFRTAGWRTSDAYGLSTLPYASVGTGNFVRTKWYVYTTDPTATSANRIPGTRLQVYNRFVVGTTTEIFTHLNDGANNAVSITGDELGEEIRPSSNPANPSLYRVDFDPVDVPFLVTNGATEGIGRAFLAQGDRPQDKGFICLAEHVASCYPANLTAATPVQVLAPAATDAGSLKVQGVTPVGGVGGPSLMQFTYPFGLSGRIQNINTSTFPTITQGVAGVTFDSVAYNNQPDGAGNPTRAGIAIAGFYPGDNLAGRPRVEQGRQYKVRFHVTGDRNSNQQAQMRLQVNLGGGVYASKYEVGGARAGGAQAQAIAAQALPGPGTQNPDRNGTETNGGWYTLIMHSPLSRHIRNESAGALNTLMPNWFTFAGPGVNDIASVYGGALGVPGALNRRDLRIMVGLLDTLSYGNNAGIVEAGQFTVDRIEVTVSPLVDDGTPE